MYPETFHNNIYHLRKYERIFKLHSFATNKYFIKVEKAVKRKNNF